MPGRVSIYPRCGPLSSNSLKRAIQEATGDLRDRCGVVNLGLQAMSIRRKAGQFSSHRMSAL
jgi:hypothetical protein